MGPSAGLAGEERNNILSLMGTEPQFLQLPHYNGYKILAPNIKNEEHSSLLRCDAMWFSESMNP